MERNGNTQNSIKTAGQMLRALARLADLNNPVQIEQQIARLPVGNSRKRNLCIAYHAYTKYYKIQWEMPKYKRDTKQFKVPTTEKCNLIIASATPDLALKLRISKTTGLRPIEVVGLTPNDIDTERKTVTPKTAKDGAPRTLPLTEDLCNALKAHIQTHNTQPNERLFPIDPHSYCNNYTRTRNRLANKLNDPTLLKIRLYDFRHYFGTTTMQKTQNVPFTAYCMGHKEWKNTQVYVDILAILNTIEEEYNSVVATTLEQFQRYINEGYQYIADWDTHTKILRKRK
jgi:integrase